MGYYIYFSPSKLLHYPQVYVAHGKLQLAMPMDKVKEASKLSLMVSFPYLNMESRLSALAFSSLIEMAFLSLF